MTLKEEIEALKRIANFHKEKPHQPTYENWMSFSGYKNLEQEIRTSWYSISNSSDNIDYSYQIYRNNVPREKKKDKHFGLQEIICPSCGTKTKTEVRRKSFSSQHGELHLPNHFDPRHNEAAYFTFEEAGAPYINNTLCPAGGKAYMPHLCGCSSCGELHWAINGMLISNHKCSPAKPRCFCAKKPSPLP